MSEHPIRLQEPAPTTNQTTSSPSDNFLTLAPPWSLWSIIFTPNRTQWHHQNCTKSFQPDPVSCWFSALPHFQAQVIFLENWSPCDFRWIPNERKWSWVGDVQRKRWTVVPDSLHLYLFFSIFTVAKRKSISFSAWWVRLRLESIAIIGVNRNGRYCRALLSVLDIVSIIPDSLWKGQGTW